MKAKLYGLSVLMLLATWAFQSNVSAQRTGQIPLNKTDTINPEDMSKSVLNEINAARQNPQQIIPYLEEYRRRFTGSRIRESDGRIITTVEGVAAVDEAIAFLRNLAAVEPLQRIEGLAKAADLQLRDLNVNPALQHTGADGSSFDERIERFGTIRGRIGENIAYRRNTARDILLLWIVDDGISSRLHRLNLFNAEFKKAGVAYGKGIDDKGLCVLELAAEFFDKDKPQAIEMF